MNHSIEMNTVDARATFGGVVALIVAGIGVVATICLLPGATIPALWLAWLVVGRQGSTGVRPTARV